MIEKRLLPLWARALLCLPALLVVWVVIDPLLTKPSPAHEGSFEPCPPKAPPGELEVGVRHPYKKMMVAGQMLRCEVEYLGTHVHVCGEVPKHTRSPMVEGCVIPKPHGYLLQDTSGLHYNVSFDLERIDPIPWGERLALRASDRPVAAIVLSLVVLGAPWLLLTRSRRRGLLVLYGLFAGSTCWLVFAFASLL